MLRTSWRRFPVAAAAVVVAGVLTPWSADGAVVPQHLITDAPTSAKLVIHNVSYNPSVIELAKGGTLTVVNKDNVTHTVTADTTNSHGKPWFNTYIPGGDRVQIPEVKDLPAGRYPFHCFFHSQMHGTLVIKGTGGGTTGSKVTFDQPLVLPKVLTGDTLRIPMEKARVRTMPTGPRTTMWTFGGSYPGPTIRRPAGQDTKVTFVNQLPSRAGSITVHFHGDHHASADDGLPTTNLIANGKSRTYDYPLTDGGAAEPAAFNFYHDHRMGRTARNNWYGLQGMFITDDPQSRRLGLPRGKYDVPLMVSERSFTNDNQLVDNFPKHPAMVTTGPHAPPGDATVGTDILVNGRYRPYFHVSTHRYRLRLLNASPFTSYDFKLSDGRSFTQIGTGDGLLPKPVTRSDILLGPAQRADVVVNFRGELHDKVVLKSVPRVSGPADGIGSASAQIMQFRVTDKVDDTSQVPSTLVAPPPITVPDTVSAEWKVNVAGDPSTGSVWTINGEAFDPNTVQVKVPRGSTQRWRLENDSPITHYIHIHEEQWHTVLRDGKPPPPWEQGLEDTWRLDPGETVEVAGTFTDYLGRFMIHCHMLDHEDHGLMAQFEVVEPGTTVPAGVTNTHVARRLAVAERSPLFASLLRAQSATDPVDLRQFMCGPESRRA